MKRRFRYFSVAALVTFTIGLCVLTTSAQESRVDFSVKAPDRVEAGKAFQIVFELNREADSFEGPDFRSFEVLGGPGYSESRYTSVVNGKRITEIRTSYTYALRAKQSGNIEIGAAQVRIGRNTYKTAPFTIAVNSGETSPPSQPDQQPEYSGDIFIHTYVSNKNPYKGEVIVLTQKLYTRLAINNIGRMKLPAFNGFWSESVEIGNYEIIQENYQGRLYNTLILSRTVLIPQRTGRITIEPSTVTIQRVVERTVDRQLWGGVIQQRVRELVENEIMSSSLTIDIKDLPAAGRSASYRGAVGNFSLEASLSVDRVVVGEPIELSIKVTGSGNLKLLDEPVILMPDKVDIFDPEISGKVDVTAGGMSGSRIYKYLIIARDSGTFEIPGIELAFFDTETRRYVQRTTGKLSFKAEFGKRGAVITTANIFKEDVKYFGEDIRYISTKLTRERGTRLTPGSWMHLTLILAPVLLLTIILLIYRKQVRVRADKQKMRSSKALLNARKRLKRAEAANASDEEQLFFEVLLDVLWGYPADKLNLQTSMLNKSNLRQGLTGKGISPETIDGYFRILEECEFLRYAPSDKSINRDTLLDSAQHHINQLDREFDQI